MKLVTALLLLVLFPYLSGSGQISNPRHPAEWEEVSGVVMGFRYFKNPNLSWDEAFAPFVKVAQACIDEGIDFYVLALSEEQSRNPFPVSLDTVFSNRNIISPFVHIIKIDSLSSTLPWVRDHGMNQVYQNDIGQGYLLNFPDDHTGKFMAGYLDIPEIEIQTGIKAQYFTDGGNFLTDGHGTFNIATSCTTDTTGCLPTGVLDEFDYFQSHLGIRQTLNLSSSFVHVDYFLKLINEETALVAYIPNNNYDISIDEFYDDQYYIDQAVISISQQLKSVYGREIKFIPIQNAPTTYDKITGIVLHTSKATYINSLILNQTVLVPQYGIEPFDGLALKTYQSAMPGYKIVGVDCRQYAHLYGAVHCLTHEIYAANPIYVKHKWYQGIVDNKPDGYPVQVTAKSADGIRQATLHWRTGKKDRFTLQPMVEKQTDLFETLIPKVNSGTAIEYFIEIENNNGKLLQKPPFAPLNAYQFTIQ